MSEHFHVHGAHEHELEHQAHHGNGLAQYVAIFTAVLSAFAAVVSYHGSAVQNEAMLLKNDAVIKVTQSVDEWSFYQAKKNKLHLMELAADIVPAKADYYKEQIERYAKESEQISQQAKSLDEAFTKDNAESNRLMASHHQESEAMMFLQIAIALASITALTRKRWLFALASVAAIIGVVLSIASWVTI